MGIRHLETYLELGVPNSYCERVKVEKLAQDYRNCSLNDPVIVVDGSYLIHHFYYRSQVEVAPSPYGLTMNANHQNSITNENYHMNFMPEFARAQNHFPIMNPSNTGNYHTTSGVKNKDFQRDFMCGGQLRSFLFYMKDFVNMFKEIGVKLEFYFDGPTVKSKICQRQERTIHKKNKKKNIFKNLDQNKNVQAFSRWTILPFLISTMGRFMVKYECGCDVFVSVNECDEDLATYAMRNGCFAILSQDTDFMCLKNAQYYFSIKRLDLGTMETLNYDRLGFMKHLELDFNQMRLFASLFGNDIVPLQKLKNFHTFICSGYERPSVDILVKNLALYVKQKTEPFEKDVEKALPNIIDDVQRLSSQNNLKCDIEVSLRSYLPSNEKILPTIDSTSSVWNSILELAYERHITCEAVPDVFGTLRGHPYEIPLLLEKPLTIENDSSSVFLPLRQRIYGVLLHEMPTDSPKEVKEFGIWHNGWHDPSKVAITNIDTDVSHPGLIALWEKKTHSIDLQRWKLFASCISKKLDPSLLQRLNCHYVVPAAVLFYLKHECAFCDLQESEIDAFIRQAVALSHLSRGTLIRRMLDVPSSRIINLATLFSFGINAVLFLMSVLGFPLRNAMPWFYFDGPVFYKEMNGRMFYKKNHSLQEEDFNTIKNILKMDSRPPTLHI